MTNKYLTKLSTISKIASEFTLSDQAKKDIVGTGTIAALGGLGTLAAHKVLPHNAGSAKVMAVGTGIGLGADYVGLKIGQAYSKHIDHGSNRSLAKHACQLLKMK